MARLLSGPHVALSEAGVELPAGMTVKAVENTDDTFHLFPPPPPEGELTNEALDKGGAGAICCHT